MISIMSELGGKILGVEKLSTDKGAEMPKTVLVVTTRGETHTIDIESDSLSKLQSAVGGLIQPVDLDDKVTMWVNEEGLLREDLEMNPLATGLYVQLLGAQTPIIGDVVFTGAPDEEGNTMELGADYMEAIKTLAENYRRAMILSL